MRRRTLLALAALAGAMTAALPAAARAGEKAKGTGEGGADSFVQINTLTAYTVRANGRRGVMTIDCGLDIPDARLRERANLLLPRLRAAFVQSVQIYAGGLPPGLPPNPDFLSRNLQRDTDEVLGRKGARLLIGAVLVN